MRRSRRRRLYTTPTVSQSTWFLVFAPVATPSLLDEIATSTRRPASGDRDVRERHHTTLARHVFPRHWSITVRIDFAEFVTSADDPRQYPSPDRPEVAFAGRSNVGKSSVINTLVHRKNLVEVSKTPGRTQRINFFNLNDEMYLVDLPGYGYADVPEEEKHAWGPMIDTYLQRRSNLVALVCIIDVRRGIERDDQQLLEAAPHFDLHPIVVFNKVDKLGSQERTQKRRHWADELGTAPDELVFFSSEDGTGKKQLWKRISDFTGIG
jgi:GTP-binding protein